MGKDKQEDLNKKQKTPTRRTVLFCVALRVRKNDGKNECLLVVPVVFAICAFEQPTLIIFFFALVCKHHLFCSNYYDSMAVDFPPAFSSHLPFMLKEIIKNKFLR